jgi:Flp pilus assembly protein TadG
MRKLLARLHRNESGQTMMLEAAIVLPILVLVAVGFVELMGLVWAKMIITNAAFEAARSAAVHIETDPKKEAATWIRTRKDAVEMIAQVRCKETLGITAKTRVVAISPDEGGDPGNNMVTVTLEVDVPLAIPLGPLRSVTMQAAGKAPLEPYYGISLD